MVITTKANMLMGSQKGLDSMNGMMEVFIKVILNKGFDVDMECGVWTIVSFVKVIKDTIRWIRNRGMVCINGKMDGYTKVIFRMIIVMGMDNCWMDRNVCIKDIGKMDSKWNQTQAQCSQKPQKQRQAFKWVEQACQNRKITTTQLI